MGYKWNTAFVVFGYSLTVSIPSNPFSFPVRYLPFSQRRAVVLAADSRLILREPDLCSNHERSGQASCLRAIRQPEIVEGITSVHELIVIADNRSSLSDRNILGVLETEASGLPDGSDLDPIIFSEMRLASVFNDHKVMLSRYLHDPVHVYRDSPANLIDLYGAVDIPEIEGFGLTEFGIKGLRTDPGKTRKNYSDLSMLKYAPSAAHITGKKLTSSETFTWLTEHFRTSLSQFKPDLDLMFCAGVNRMLFHGTCYSPKDEPWSASSAKRYSRRAEPNSRC